MTKGITRHHAMLAAYHTIEYAKIEGNKYAITNMVNAINDVGTLKYMVGRLLLSEAYGVDPFEYQETKDGNVRVVTPLRPK